VGAVSLHVALPILHALVVGVGVANGDVGGADLARVGALGGEAVEVEAVAAADLGDEGELLGEVQYALGGAVVVGVAVLHEAVEEVPVAAAGAGADAAARDGGVVVDHARVGFG